MKKRALLITIILTAHIAFAPLSVRAALEDYIGMPAVVRFTESLAGTIKKFVRWAVSPIPTEQARTPADSAVVAMMRSQELFAFAPAAPIAPEPRGIESEIASQSETKTPEVVVVATNPPPAVVAVPADDSGWKRGVLSLVGALRQYVQLSLQYQEKSWQERSITWNGVQPSTLNAMQSVIQVLPSIVSNISRLTVSNGINVESGSIHVGAGDLTVLGTITGSRVRFSSLTVTATSSYMGNTSIGTSTVDFLFSVATSSDIFNVSSSGLVYFRGVPYLFPDAQGSASTVLTNDGSGNLSWAASGGGGGSGGGWTRDAAGIVRLSTSTDRVGVGTAFPSSTLHLSGANTSTLSLGTTASGGKRLDFRLGAVSSGAFDLYDFTSSTSRLYIGPNGNIAVGTTTAPALFSVNGAIAVTDTSQGFNIGSNRVLYASSTNFSTLVGIGAGTFMTSGGNYNTAVGYEALSTSTTGDNNTAVGWRSMLSTISGSENVAVGSGAMYLNTSGGLNTAMGSYALEANVTSSESVAIGAYALTDAVVSYNTALGAWAGFSVTTGGSNTLIGYEAQNYNRTGSNNVIIGHQAGRGAVAQSNSNNTFVGYRSGYGVTSGSNNLAFGYQAGDNITSGANNIIIGYDIDAPSATNSNQLNIGNILFGTNLNGTGTAISAANIGIGNSAPAGIFHVSSSIIYASSTSGYVGIGTSTPRGQLHVEGAIAANPQSNAFGTDSIYTALVLGEQTGGDISGGPLGGNGGLFAFGRYNTALEPFTGLSGFDDSVARTLYFGGGGWGVPDATLIRFYTAPSYSETNNTGQIRMSITSAGNVGIGNTSPTGILHVSSSVLYASSTTGYVGIGTTSPNNLLHVNGTAQAIIHYASSFVGTGQVTAQYLGVSQDLSIDSGSSANILFRADTTELARLTNAGRFGLGTQSPSSTLHLSGASTSTLSLANRIADGKRFDIRVGSVAAGVLDMYDFTSSTSRLVIAANGNIGINTSTPSAALYVNGNMLASAANGRIIGVDGLSSGQTVHFQFGGDSSNEIETTYGSGPVIKAYHGLTVQNASTGGVIGPALSVYNYQSDRLALRIQAASGQTANIFEWSDATPTILGGINPLGHMGVGTQSPSSTLHLSGASTSLSLTGITSGRRFDIRNGNVAAGVFDIFDFTSSTSRLVLAQNGTMGVGNATSGYLMNTSTPAGSLVIYNGALCVDDSSGTCDNAGRIAGQIYAKSASVTAVDLAEHYETGDPSIESGDVVAVAENAKEMIRKAVQNDQAIVGIVSTEPGLVLGAQTPTSRPVALAGRVPVKVSLENGPIKAGDYLSVSGRSGVAVRQVEPGMYIGIALESLDTEANASGSLMVVAFVQSGFGFGNPQDEKPESAGLLGAIREGFAKFGAVIEQGMLTVQKLVAKAITAEEVLIEKRLCIEEVCIDKGQLRAILERTGVSGDLPPAVIESPAATEPAPVPQEAQAPPVADDPAPVENPPDAAAEPLPEPQPSVVPEEPAELP